MWRTPTTRPGDYSDVTLAMTDDVCLPRLLAQTTLRNILGTKNLHEILSDRESISSSMQVWQLAGKQLRIIMMLFRVFLMKPQLPGGSRWRGLKCE